MVVASVVMLDAGPLGLVANLNPSSQALACTQWLRTLVLAGARVIVPEIADYETRRELWRACRRVAKHSAALTQCRCP